MKIVASVGNSSDVINSTLGSNTGINSKQQANSDKSKDTDLSISTVLKEGKFPSSPNLSFVLRYKETSNYDTVVIVYLMSFWLLNMQFTDSLT